MDVEEFFINLTASLWAALPSLISAAILAVLGVIVRQLKEAAKDRKAQYEEQRAHNALSVEADQATLYAQIEQACDKCVEKGICDPKARKNIAIQFSVYQRLDGNHGLEAQVKHALSLPAK